MLKTKKPSLAVGQKSADALKSVLAVDLVKENRFKNLLRVVKDNIDRAGILLPIAKSDTFLSIDEFKVLYSSQLKDYEQSKFRLEKIGFIYQFHHLIKELNVFENISLPLLLQNMKKDEVFGCVNDIIDKIGLNKRKYFQIDKLSGGEKQRVAIARAIINKPKIIFADEPTGNLDNKNAKNIFSLLNDLAKINNTILMVATHDDQLTQMLDKKIAIISGEIKSL